MDKLDKTKKKIGVTDLDERDRKDLFNKFVDHGGKVIDEKTKRKNLIIDRRAQKSFKNKLDAKSEKQAQSSKRKLAGGKVIKGQPQIMPVKKQKADNLFTRFLTRMKIRLKLKLLGVTQFSGVFFDIKFLEKFNNSYKPSLLEIQMIFFDIFKSDPPLGRTVTAKMDKIKPIYYEVLEMLGNVNDNTIVNRIAEHYINYPSIPKSTVDLKEPLMSLFKSIIVLKLYENTILGSFERAMIIKARLENSKPSSYSQQKKKIKNCLYNIFHKLYPRLLWLFCFYEGKILDIGDPEIDTILSIKKEDKPGNRGLMKVDEAETDEEFEPSSEGEETDEETEEEKIEVSDSIKRGLKIFAGLDLKKMRKDYDEGEQFKFLSIRDKILITYLLFSEFDREYSCILTTNKIKYRVDFNRSGKRDYKARMLDLYDQMRRCFDSFKNYAETSDTYKKMDGDKPLNNNQFLQYSKRLADVQKKKTNAAQLTRNSVKTYMDSVSELLDELIEDMGSDRVFIENQDEILEFIPQIEGDKKINGMKISQAITYVNDFISAFAYKLDFGGSLTGSFEYDDEKTFYSTKVSINDHKKDVEKKEEQPRSILDELDDVL